MQLEGRGRFTLSCQGDRAWQGELQWAYSWKRLLLENMGGMQGPQSPGDIVMEACPPFPATGSVLFFCFVLFYGMLLSGRE